MESLSRISGMLETARDLTLDAARDAGNLRKTSARALPAAQLKKLLDSRHDREVLDGLRRVISMTYRGQHTLAFFSAVIKNIASPTLEIKKLVYIYLLHHAEAEPDTALLSINTIQKSLTDQNPQLRALALRVMSGIRVPVISQIVSLGIKRGAGDMSPYVRKAAALAIPKCYRLDPNTLPQLLEYLSTLLGDKQYYVAGAAVVSFLEICPERLDLIHPHYRSLVRKLVDMDEWGQLATLRLMLIYARKCFPRRTRRVKKSSAPKTRPTKGFYDSDSDSSPDDPSDYTEEAYLDPDLTLFLTSSKPLLQSRNSAVILSLTRCYLYLGNSTHLTSAIGPLIALLRSPESIRQIALYNIVQICLLHPDLFVPHYRHFFLRSSEPLQIWRLKLELLTLTFPASPRQLQNLILAELSHFSRSSSSYDSALVREAVRAIGRCASNSPDAATSARCLRLLLAHIGTADAHLVAESLEVIRHLIQRDPDAHRGTVVRLAKHLDVAKSTHARASIIWLVGEFAGMGNGLKDSIAPDVLRILVKGFADEEEPAKLQILLLAAKVYLHWLNETQPENTTSSQDTPAQPSTTDSSHTHYSTALASEDGGFSSSPPSSSTPAQPTHPIPLLYTHTLTLTRYDPSYTLRDRARLIRSLLPTPNPTSKTTHTQPHPHPSTALATLLLLAPKPVPQIPNPSSARQGFVLGSASLVLGDLAGQGGVRGYEEVPEWVKEGEEPDAGVRDEEVGGGAGGWRNAEYAAGRTLTAAEQLDLQAGASGGGGVDKGIGATGGKGVNGKEKTLDDWLAESEGEDQDDSGSDESEEDGSTEYETDSEEEEDEEEDDNDDEQDRLVK